MDTEKLKNQFAKMSVLELATEQLSRDLLYYKIPPEQVEHYVSTALQIGIDRAKACPSRDIYELCSSSNIRIEETSAKGKYFGVRVRAEIHLNVDETKIVLYRQSVDDIAENISHFFADVNLSREVIRRMHIAHEYLHYIEWRDDSRVNELLPQVTTFSLLGYKRKATILTLSEVAAHSFSKELLQLPHYPYLYDKIYALSL